MPKILITIATLIYGIAPLFADLNTSHVFHPEWTPHARFHMVWLLATNSSLAALAMWLLWYRSQLIPAAILGIFVVGGFWVSTLTKPLYDGALGDQGGVDVKMLGLDANALAFGVVLVLLVAGLALSSRK